MSLLPSLTDAELLEMHAKRTGFRSLSPIVRQSAPAPRPAIKRPVSVPSVDLAAPRGTMSLPWAVLEHDNHRLMPVVLRGGKVRNITAPRYRAAKEAVSTLLMALWHGPALVGPVEVRGVAYFPDLRKRDAGNYRKLITDALTGIAYGDDSQVHREVWERGPLDRDNPRIEISVRLLE